MPITVSNEENRLLISMFKSDNSVVYRRWMKTGPPRQHIIPFLSFIYQKYEVYELYRQRIIIYFIVIKMIRENKSVMFFIPSELHSKIIQEYEIMIMGALDNPALQDLFKKYPQSHPNVYFCWGQEIDTTIKTDILILHQRNNNTDIKHNELFIIPSPR